MLDQREASSFVDERFNALDVLNGRYLQEIDLRNGFPCKPEYLDALRNSWMLDSKEGKPPFAVVVRALGVALGLTLQATFEMRWGIIRDSLGEVISMIHSDEAGNHISVPPFSYVEKKENVQNVEVFVDLFTVLRNNLRKAA